MFVDVVYSYRKLTLTGFHLQAAIVARGRSLQICTQTTGRSMGGKHETRGSV